MSANSRKNTSSKIHQSEDLSHSELNPSYNSNWQHKKQESVLRVFHVFANCILVALALILCTYFKMQDFPVIYRLLLIIAIFLALVIYSLVGVYQRVEKFHQMALRITYAWALTIMVLIVFAFLTKTSEQYSREVMITWFLLVAIVQVPFLRLQYSIAVYFRRINSKPLSSIIIGTDPAAVYFAKKLESNHWLPDKVVGFVGVLDRRLSKEVGVELSFPLLGEVQNIKGIISEHGIKRVYISLPLEQAARVKALNEQLSEFQVDVIWMLDIADWKLMNHSVREVAGVPLLSLNENPVNVSRVQIGIKHILDKIIAIVMLIVLSPIILGAAIAVKITSRGAVLFKQKRHGYGGEEISIYKFRSMYEHNDTVVQQAVKNDSRITKVGAFLRKTSIDELPQLYNVLQGRISLVGPRPHAIEHNHFYSDKISQYMARHKIKPGITGLAQISGCRGETDTLEKMEDRVELDMQYINNWSLWGDMVILLKTPLSLFAKDIY